MIVLFVVLILIIIMLVCMWNDEIQIKKELMASIDKFSEESYQNRRKHKELIYKLMEYDPANSKYFD